MIEFSQTVLAEKNSEVCMAMLLVRTQLVSISCFLSTFFVTEFLFNDLANFVIRLTLQSLYFYMLSERRVKLQLIVVLLSLLTSSLLFIFLLPSSL